MNQKRTFSHPREKLDIHLEEYRSSSNEILRRVEYQQKLLNYQLLAAGVVVGAAIRFAELDSFSGANSIAVRYFLLLSPLVFLCFSWSFSNHDIMIQSVARYIYTVLKPKIEALVPGEKVLEWEEFLVRERRLKQKSFLLLLPGGEEYLLPLILPLILLIIYIYFLLPGNSDTSEILNSNNRMFNVLWTLQYIVFAFDIVLFFITIILKAKVSFGYLRILEISETPRADADN